jgi:hypothetical protein
MEVEEVTARPRRPGPTENLHAPFAVRSWARDDPSLPRAQPTCATAQSLLLLRFVLPCGGHPLGMRSIGPDVNAQPLNRSGPDASGPDAR